MSTADRRGVAAAALPDDLDALLVTNLVNVRYLTGFTGSNGAVLLHRDGGAVFATDSRYREQAGVESADLPLNVSRTPAAALAATMPPGARLGIERRHVTLALYDVLAAAGPDTTLVGTDGIVETLRQVKDDDELAALRQSCAATDAVYDDVLSFLRPGVTEQQVAWRLLEGMRAHGAEGEAFDSIVAFGPHSTVPHHRPTSRPLQRGDLVKLDFGARVRGYHADMTRTCVCGPPSAWQQELHAQVRSAQQRCLERVVVGAVPVELDDFARDLVAATGNDVLHGLGHGVGLEIHERPFLVPRGDSDPLQPGTVCTVEPGIYLPGRGGVRIEDSVLVSAGGPQPLTRSSRELVQV